MIASPQIGEVWIGGARHWRCVRNVGEAQPGEPLREWECVRGGRNERGRTGQFGDRYVRAYWRRG